ncbi:hypothetical protein LVJ82_00810 [Vitreoscilla massiliensis]|uniref:Uncharacterized protein n=1 Tax=Vitreoscilla massiliensis TaxID=1689272 RepID=A0ABY4E2G6_9NEIS|nr:hypothetical protein [Vitreoscilla massiliensis]UOO89088.1 hypothetical protein LVJ82_16850 [Vitreoscilla massiliensis]UOO89556.1 hypothetical protein LVJ82_00810 [Vitreoscilla massiliensis]
MEKVNANELRTVLDCDRVLEYCDSERRSINERMEQLEAVKCRGRAEKAANKEALKKAYGARYGVDAYRVEVIQRKCELQRLPQNSKAKTAPMLPHHYSALAMCGE